MEKEKQEFEGSVTLPSGFGLAMYISEESRSPEEMIKSSMDDPPTPFHTVSQPASEGKPARSAAIHGIYLKWDDGVIEVCPYRLVAYTRAWCNKQESIKSK